MQGFIYTQAQKFEVKIPEADIRIPYAQTRSQANIDGKMNSVRHMEV
jgi:hypothetical protein